MYGSACRCLRLVRDLCPSINFLAGKTVKRAFPPYYSYRNLFAFASSRLFQNTILPGSGKAFTHEFISVSLETVFHHLSMKRLSVIPILLVLLFGEAKASHITGGEMFYKFTGMSGGLYEYDVTLRLLQRCNSGRQFLNPTIVSVFDKTTNARITDIMVPISSTDNISIGNPDP